MHGAAGPHREDCGGKTFGGPSFIVVDVDDARWRLRTVRTVRFDRAASPRRC